MQLNHNSDEELSQEDFIARNRNSLAKQHYEKSLEKTRADLVDLEKEIKAAQSLCPGWTPKSDEDYEKAKMTFQYTEMNRKMILNIGQLMKAVETAVKKTQDDV